MGGRASKAKGYRAEAKLVKMHEAIGIQAERVPLSGAAGGSYTGDLTILDGEFRAECKARKEGAGFKTIEKWMQDCDMIFLFRDRQEPFVCMDWKTYRRIMSPQMDYDIEDIFKNPDGH